MGDCGKQVKGRKRHLVVDSSRSRFIKDDELYTKVSEAMIYGSLIPLMLKRLELNPLFINQF